MQHDPSTHTAFRRAACSADMFAHRIRFVRVKFDIAREREMLKLESARGGDGWKGCESVRKSDRCTFCTNEREHNSAFRVINSIIIINEN